MKPSKKQKAQKAGWKVGSAKEFLGLDDEEMALIDMKLGLASALKTKRQAKRYTQIDLAEMIGSSQSRVAKMEAGDPSVSTDLLIRGMLALGATPKEIAKALGQTPKAA